MGLVRCIARRCFAVRCGVPCLLWVCDPPVCAILSALLNKEEAVDLICSSDQSVRACLMKGGCAAWRRHASSRTRRVCLNATFVYALHIFLTFVIKVYLRLMPKWWYRWRASKHGVLLHSDADCHHHRVLRMHGLSLVQSNAHSAVQHYL